MSLLKTNEIQVFNGTTVTITATTTETSADLNVGADLDVTGALTLGTALAVAEGGTGATDAATARTNLDVDQAGTDNSTDCTLVTTSHDYLSISGQAITLGPIDLAADVTGSLPYASISGTPTLATVATSGAYSDLSGTPTLGTAAAEDVGYFATAAQGTLADSAVQPGDDADTLGSGAATDGYVLTADGAGNAAWEASLPINLLSSGASIRKSDGTTAVLSESGGAVTLENTSLGDTVLMPDNSNNISTAPGIRFEADTDTGIGLASAGNLAVVTGGTERMRIDSSGNLLIGTTTANGKISSAFSGSTGYYAETAQNNGNFFYLLRSGVTYVRHIISGSSYQIINFTSGGVSLSAGGTSWGAVSDEREKDIIEPINSAAEKVASLRAVIGKYKKDDPEKRRAFLIAQDVQAVLPEAVYTNSENDDTLNLAYTDTIPLLVAAIKELKAELDTVKAELATLKG